MRAGRRRVIGTESWPVALNRRYLTLNVASELDPANARCFHPYERWSTTQKPALWFHADGA